HEAEDELLVHRRAWRDLRLQQCEERVWSVDHVRFCVACPKPLSPANERRWCSPQCEKKEKATSLKNDVDADIVRVCHACHRHFQSTVRRVFAFVEARLFFDDVAAIKTDTVKVAKIFETQAQETARVAAADTAARD